MLTLEELADILMRLQKHSEALINRGCHRDLLSAAANATSKVVWLHNLTLHPEDYLNG